MSVQSLNLFSIPIAKFAVDKWDTKKDKKETKKAPIDKKADVKS